jgi:hypothetical protein
LAPSSCSALPLRSHSSRFLLNTSKSLSGSGCYLPRHRPPKSPARHLSTFSPTFLLYAPLESIEIMCNITRIVLVFQPGIFLFLLHFVTFYPQSYPSRLPSHIFILGYGSCVVNRSNFPNPNLVCLGLDGARGPISRNHAGLHSGPVHFIPATHLNVHIVSPKLKTKNQDVCCRGCYQPSGHAPRRLALAQSMGNDAWKGQGWSPLYLSPLRLGSSCFVWVARVCWVAHNI